MQSRRWWRSTGGRARVCNKGMGRESEREGEAVPQIMVVNRMAAVNCKADMKVAVYQVATTSDGRATHAMRLLTRINYVSLSAPATSQLRGDLDKSLSHNSPRRILLFGLSLRLSFPSNLVPGRPLLVKGVHCAARRMIYVA